MRLVLERKMVERFEMLLNSWGRPFPSLGPALPKNILSPTQNGLYPYCREFHGAGGVMLSTPVSLSLCNRYGMGDLQVVRHPTVIQHR